MFKSISHRLMFNSVVVAIVTTFIGLLALVSLTAVGNVFTTGDRMIAMFTSIPWLYDLSPEELEEWNIPDGSALVVDLDDEIVYVQGESACAVGMMLSECAPEWANRPLNEPIREGGEAFIMLEMQNGYRLISQRQRLTPAYYILSLFAPALTLTLLSVPVAFLVAKVTSRYLARRLEAITSANTRFANGDFTARVDDYRQDDIGQLAQQFNSMADVLEQNVYMLRDLAQRNTQLIHEAEDTAIQVERGRLSRELHDSIAQQLFSLSTNSATLPDLIQRDSAVALEQAQRIASLAEQANLDLRAMLVDLRPTDVIRRGLADALEAMCNDWQMMNNIPSDCTVMLRGGHIPAGIEDAAYRITQEALNNVAKHAQSKTVSISVLQGQNQLILSVTDDGRGFNPDLPQNSGHFGLIGMRERARVVGGQFSIESDTGRGTTVKVTLPLKSV